MDTVKVKGKGESPRRHSHAARIAGIAVCSLGGLLLLVALMLTGATLWLTPDRLSAIVNREASRYLEADVRVKDMRFSIWSTFPHFYLEADSINVVSRTLRGIPAGERALLPADADSLMSAGRFHGSINILDLLAGRVSLREVEMEGLTLNLVDLNDSVNNYDIVPAESRGSYKIPYITADTLRLLRMQPLRYFSAASDTHFSAPVSRAMLIRKGHDRYQLLLSGEANLAAGGLQVLRGFPFSLDGRLSTSFHPFSLRLSDFNVTLANTRGHIDMDMSVGENVDLNRFSYSVEDFNPLQLLSYIPGVEAPFLRDLKADLHLVLSARLLSPYHFSPSSLPSIGVDFRTSGGSLEYSFSDGECVRLRDLDLLGSFLFDGKNPANSIVKVDELSLRGYGSRLSVQGVIRDLTGNPAINAHVSGKVDISRARQLLAVSGPYRLRGEVDCDADISFILTDASEATFTDLLASGMVSSKHLSIKGEGIKGDASGVKMKFKSSASRLSGTTIRDMKGSIAMSLADGSLETPDFAASLQGVTLSAGGERDKRGLKGFEMPVAKDARTLARTSHTPEYLSIDLPKQLRRLYAGIGFKLAGSVRSGEFRTPSFPVANRFKLASFSADNDKVSINGLALRSQSSGASVSGRISGLRDLLVSGMPTPLKADLSIALDTVNINQLAHAYAHGLVLTKGSDSSLSAPKPEGLSHSDTVTLLIPRNLEAHVKASAKETRYTDLHLYDLSTRLDITDGKAVVDSLKIFSDFGHAYLNLDYDTSDALNIGVALSAGLEDIDVVRFFERFHTLLLMMPQMSNLSGEVSADVGMRMHMYPDMYADVPSLKARVQLSGRGLTVHQDPFIRRITRMMMIRTSDDLHIADMDVRASIHDNLLELYPFNFDFDSYRLRMQGINNFAGRLYYHIGIEKSPLHLPFGINIQGMFRHPELRFGGATYKVEKGAEIAADVMEDDSFNIMRELKYYMQQFVKKAAEADSTSCADYSPHLSKK